MQVVTRPDFDGVVCAVLLKDALQIESPVRWVQPGDLQRGEVDIQRGDVVANLPYHENCSLWFDHHVSNRPDFPVTGAFAIAPSAAGLIYTYYRDQLADDYEELVHQTDRIDAADLTREEVLHPQVNPYVLLSMTINGNDPDGAVYWNRLVSLLQSRSLDKVMRDSTVKLRCEQVLATNRQYEKALFRHTGMVAHVSVTDFRGVDPPPDGNRFLVYCLFPDCTVNVKIVDHVDKTLSLASIKVGHNIFNPGCKVNVGTMLASFEGGGHFGAGACRFAREKAPEYLDRIVAILVGNQPD